jgi:hypothetical protein
MTLPCRTWARHMSVARSCRSTRTPAPVVLTALAHHRRQYAGPRGVRCRAVVSAMSVSIAAGRPAYHG